MIKTLLEASLTTLRLTPTCLLILFLVAPFLVPHAGELSMTGYVLIVLLATGLVNQGIESHVQVVEVDAQGWLLVQPVLIEILLQIVKGNLDLFRGRLVCHSKGL